MRVRVGVKACGILRTRGAAVPCAARIDVVLQSSMLTKKKKKTGRGWK